jgi:thiol:disulfide interchange protein
MRKLFFLLTTLAFSNLLFSQIESHVKFETSTKDIGAGSYELQVKALLDKGWHIYSSRMKTGGPIPTTFKINKDKDFTIISDTITENGTAIVKWDTNYKQNLIYYGNTVTFSQITKYNTSNTDSIKGNLNFMICNDEMCLPPEDYEVVFFIKAKETTAANKITNEAKINDNSNPDSKPKSLSLLQIFILSFIGGLAALLTPCVFPMIPMTVSYFTKKGKTRKQGIKNALIYSASIIVLYVALGLTISSIFGIDALNAMATNVWFNVIFFIILIVFAASFLGAFEITLPSSFVNKIDSQSDRGGLLGIFFMALTLSLVSFSCTGPIIGTLLFESAVSGNIKGPLIGMIGFSSALALPFGLFALFPNWLKSLPKSGSWLNSVKIVLGLLELALAFKFLSNADLVTQTGLLTREIFIAIWIGIFAILTFYLLGFIKFSHDDDKPIKLSVFRSFFAIIVLSFTIYLIPGLWGAPLKLINGFPPPDFYKEWKNNTPTNTAFISTENKTNVEDAHCPNNLNCFHDYDEALAYAKKVDKPLLVDFTGWACVNCRKMEGNVWTDSKIDNLIRNEVVLVSLYVDDQRALPLEEKAEKELGGKKYKINTVGNKWSYFQAEKFQTNSQPYYVLLDNNGNKLSLSAGYNPNINEYETFLKIGIEKYKIENGKN